MDLRSTPERIVAAHGANEFANVAGNGRTARLATSDLPGPEQAKSFAMLSHDGRGFHDVDAGPPVLPDGTEPRPQHAVSSCQLGPFDRALQDADLVAKRKDLQLERSPAPKQP